MPTRNSRVCLFVVYDNANGLAPRKSLQSTLSLIMRYCLYVYVCNSGFYLLRLMHTLSLSLSLFLRPAFINILVDCILQN